MDTLELTTARMGVVDATSEPIINGRSQAGVGFSAVDAHPLFVRYPTLLVSKIKQSTAIQCAANTISVSLMSNVPLLTTFECSPQITISGLEETATFDPFLAISNVKANTVAAPEIVYANASW